MRKFAAFLLLIFLVTICGCSDSSSISDNSELSSENSVSEGGLTLLEHVENEFAQQFSIDRYEGGYSMITTMNNARYLVVPEGCEPPENLDNDVVVIQQPAENFYLAATAAMGHFAEIGAGDAIKFSSIQAEDWYVDYAREAMNSGKMIYAGKYREPDYELLLSGGC